MKYILENQQSTRLFYRLITPSDFDAWLPLFDTQEAYSFLGLDASKSPHELCEFWFKKLFHRYENDLGGMNALIDKASNQFIGQCGLLVQQVDGEERLEIGYSILPAFWGKGYASEAAAKCKAYAFAHEFSESLISIVHVDNIASEMVARKNGMSLEKTLDDYKGMPVNVFSIRK
jgi:RimJ/RimL family protein N-acetyltransferase